MVATAGDFKAAGISVPLLVGGAALSDRFTRTRIAPAYGNAVLYAKDAMTGLRLMNGIMDPAEREATLALGGAEVSSGDAVPKGGGSPEGLAPQGSARSGTVRADIPIPPAPYLERKLRDVPDLAEVWSYINPYMLYGKHLGYKGNFEKALGEREAKALELFHAVEAVKQEAAGFMRVKTVWQFFEAERAGNAIRLFAPGGARVPGGTSSPPADTTRRGGSR